MTEDGIDYAIAMVNAVLAEGAKPYADVKQFCKEREITKGELKAARKILGVKTTKAQDDWLWSLPKEGEIECVKKISSHIFETK